MNNRDNHQPSAESVSGKRKRSETETSPVKRRNTGYQSYQESGQTFFLPDSSGSEFDSFTDFFESINGEADFFNLNEFSSDSFFESSPIPEKENPEQTASEFEFPPLMDDDTLSELEKSIQKESASIQPQASLQEPIIPQQIQNVQQPQILLHILHQQQVQQQQLQHVQLQLQQQQQQQLQQQQPHQFQQQYGQPQFQQQQLQPQFQLQLPHQQQSQQQFRQQPQHWFNQQQRLAIANQIPIQQQIQQQAQLALLQKQARLQKMIQEKQELENKILSLELEIKQDQQQIQQQQQRQGLQTLTPPQEHQALYDELDRLKQQQDNHYHSNKKMVPTMPAEKYSQNTFVYELNGIKVPDGIMINDQTKFGGRQDQYGYKVCLWKYYLRKNSYFYVDTGEQVLPGTWLKRLEKTTKFADMENNREVKSQYAMITAGLDPRWSNEASTKTKGSDTLPIRRGIGN